MERFDMSQPGYAGTVSDAAERVTGFLRVVYGWMAVGLTLTAIVAWMVASSETLVYTIATNRLLFWGLFIAQLGVVSSSRPACSAWRQASPRPSSSPTRR